MKILLLHRLRQKWLPARLSWKTSASINTAAVAGFSLALTIMVIYGCAKARAIRGSFVVFQGPCRTARGFNIFLHLLLNVAATLILSSSNFFMQLVAAPSRLELDRAHGLSRWLDMGVPTARNFASVSAFKRVAWLVLAASSIPIHLLFNSSIFFVESQRATFTMTMASEPFLAGAAYYPPGATLWNMDVPENCTQPRDMTVATRCSQIVNEYELGVWDAAGTGIYCRVKPSSPGSCANDSTTNQQCGAQEPVSPEYCVNGATGKTGIDPEAIGARRINCTAPETMDHAILCANGLVSASWKGPDNRTLADFLDPSSEVNANISRASKARINGWTRLDAMTCRSQYMLCGEGRGLQDYGDVVLVLSDGVSYDRGKQMTAGWTRRGIFEGMSESDSLFWDQLVPAGALNSLYYTSRCTMKQNFTRTEGLNSCRNSCANQMSVSSIYVTDPNSVVSADSPSIQVPLADWFLNFFDHGASLAWKIQMRSGNIQEAGNTMEVAYCLAEPVANGSGSGSCKIGASNTALLIVTLCVITKAIQCGLVTSRLVWRHDSHPPLITLGDAVDSLLRRPDPATEGICTLAQADVPGLGQNMLVKGGNHAAKARAVPFQRLRARQLPYARQWIMRQRRYFSAVTNFTWLGSYTLFLLFAAGGLVCLYLASGQFTISLRGFGINSRSFVLLDPDGQNYSGDFLSYAILANTPQLLFSVWYLIYNSLLTRLHMAREWALMSTDYRPLRVTEPKGRQSSTYTLQLPLSWGVPSMILSILTHFFVSNSLYVFVSDGGFFGTANSRNLDDSIGLSHEGFIGLGYSALGIAISLVAFGVMACVPLVVSAIDLPGSSNGNILVVGTNSLAISASCHASSLTKALPAEEEEAEIEKHRLLVPVDDGDDGERTPRIDGPQTPSPKFNEERHQPLPSDEENGSYKVTPKMARDFLAEGLIRWGVVQMPPTFYEKMVNAAGMDQKKIKVRHLSFGVQADDVEDPVHGRWYA